MYWFACIGLGSALLVGRIFLSLQTRSYALERQDKSPEDGFYTIHEYNTVFKALRDLNTLTPFGYNATLAALNTLNESSITSIVEIGFGAGDFSIQLARKYPNATVLGIDAHELSVAAANANAKEYRERENTNLANLQFQHIPVDRMIETSDNSFDIVTTTLVNHHIFPDSAFVDFLLYIRRVGKTAFVFNDLYRSFPCYMQTVLFLEPIKWIGPDVSYAILDSILFVLEAIVNMNMNVNTASGTDPTSTSSTPDSSTLSAVLPTPVANSVLATVVAIIEKLKLARDMLIIFKTHRVATNMVIDGGILSIAKSFTLAEYKDMFLQAGFQEAAVNCISDSTSCRITCVADLQS
jgi:2-polyprenyl-3-methyl-5-hydroxy-6-metoxy-1,4-benzoquinol methylase